MSINTEMTSLADAIRTKSGTTGKLSIAGMTDAVNSIVITGGGDIDLSFVTASAEHILTGKVGADRDGKPVYGTLEITGDSDIDLTGVTVTADTMLSGIVAINANGEKVTGNIPTVVATLNDNIVTVPVGYIAEEQNFDGFVSIQYGYVNDDGKFQELTLSGEYPEAVGEASNITTLELYKTGAYEPDYKVETPDVYYKCASVNSDMSKWSGHKVEFLDGFFVIQSDSTVILDYGTGYTPKVGSIYNANATVEVARLCTAAPTDGLVVYAKLTSTTNTVTETGDPISYQNCTVDDSTGKTAMRFDGDSVATIEVPTDKLPSGASPRTISFWGLADDYTRTWMSFLLYGEDNPDNKLFCIRANNGNISLGFSYNDHDSDINIAGSWHHFAVTYAYTHVEIYVDGVSVFTVDLDSSLNTSYSTIKVGGGVDDGTNLRGYMFGLRIYNRVLTADEIVSLVGATI